MTEIQALFARASIIPYLAGLSREEARRRLVAGDFGPRYLPKGVRRGALLRLDLVLAALGLTEEDLAPAIARYDAAHKQSRPPVLNLKPEDVAEIAP